MSHPNHAHLRLSPSDEQTEAQDVQCEDTGVRLLGFQSQLCHVLTTATLGMFSSVHQCPDL